MWTITSLMLSKCPFKSHIDPSVSKVKQGGKREEKKKEIYIISKALIKAIYNRHLLFHKQWVYISVINFGIYVFYNQYIKYFSGGFTLYL